MASEVKDRDMIVLRDTEDRGSIKVTDEVVMIIAGLAATEVEGVTAMNDNMTKEIISRLGINSLSKGVKITTVGSAVKIDLKISVDFGVSIPKVSQAVQERVKNAVETMTGLQVESVSVRIAGLNIDKNE